jgi:Tol biopolymer transport system component
MDVLRPFAVLVAALVVVSGAAGTGVTPRPLLTYAVYPPGDVHGGLCATDLQGHSFRVTDPHDSRSPAWSPDGRSIAFTRWDGPRGEKHFDDVIVTDSEGRHARNLTRRGNYGTFRIEDWSPDGRELLLNWSGLGSSLYVRETDGSGRRTLVEGGSFLSGGSWSPTGKILFAMRASSEWAVYVVDADGGHRKKVIDSAYAPEWSPDGLRFAYVALHSGQPEGLGVANADGSGARLLVEGRVSAPTWSPDGRQLAYFAGLDSAGLSHALDVVEIGNGSARRLAAGNLLPTPPAWSPDGTSIAFTRGRFVGGKAQAPKLVLSASDGTRQTPVDTGGLPASDPAWRRPGSLPSDRRPCIVHGTARADVIRGTDRGDLVYGKAGDDRIRGNGGDDVLVGGRGHDRLDGGGGDDRFRANDNVRDFLNGGPGRDRGRFDSVDVVRSVVRSS